MPDYNVRILVCGMSRSGSTLLVKMIRKYFAEYHGLVLPVLSNKQFLNAPPRSGNYIVKTHVPDVSIKRKYKHDQPRDPDDKELKQYFSLTDIFRTKRDIRDAAASEIISLNLREHFFPSDAKALLTKNEDYESPYLREIVKKLHREHMIWAHTLSRVHTHPDFTASSTNTKWYEWKYEDSISDQHAAFRNVLAFLKERHDFIEDLDDASIANLLASLPDPVELPRSEDDFRGLPREFWRDPEKFASENVPYKKRLGWDVGVSSTGGKIGYYKEFFTKEQLKVIDGQCVQWLKRNGYK